MKKIQFSTTGVSVSQYDGDMIFTFVSQNKNKKPVTGSLFNNVVKKLAKLGDFTGKDGETLVLYPDLFEGEEKVKAKRICLIGTGTTSENNNDVFENCRKYGGIIAKTAKKHEVVTGLLDMGELKKDTAVYQVQNVTEGIILGSYTFNKYKKKEKKKLYFGIEKIKFYTKATALSRKGIKLGERSGLAGCEARRMALEPGSNWTPTEFAKFAKNLSSKTKIKCTVFDKKKLQSLKMGGILAVNQGSVEEPKMVILDHEPAKYTQTILLVGKGLTFDSGGVSLKPAAGMQDMKYDMCGGAAVISAMQVIAEEKPGVRVVAIVPSTDNMVSGAALKPGDIITHYNGTTSEIINTDAEGRLILADAIAYGKKHYSPDCIVNLATLTGAVVVALGHHTTGLLSNNDTLVEKLLEAGDRTGEPLWRLPLGKEYSKQIESTVADIKNTGGRGAGTCTAGAYLEKFVDDTPWAHLDIAGTAWDFSERSYIPKGPSGTGVRTLVEFIRQWKKTKF